MKRVLLFVTLVLSCAMYGFAQQDNEKISYQAVVRDSENRLVSNRNLSVTVAIANSAGGAAVFTERHAVTSNANGLISLLIGGGERLSGSWENIRWNTAVVTASILDVATMEELVEHVLPLQAVPYSLYANYADSTNLQPMRDELADTAAALRSAMPAAANDGKLTIRRNGQDLGIFTADQAGDTEVNIVVPEKISDLLNDSRFADTTVNNHFTGDNRFTGHNVVIERGFYLDGANATTVSNCQVMVNACDLLALFDSLQNRMNGVKDSLNKRIDSLVEVIENITSTEPPVFNSLTLSDITTESIKATAEFTTVGAPISSYQFCISKNADMNNPIGCYTSDVNVYTFTGLEPYTMYYITASATNVAGTVNSDPESKRTLAHAPTAVVTAEQHKPTGFVVNVSSLDFQEPANGSVQICYKQKEGDNCPVDASEVYAEYTACVIKGNVANSTNIAEIISENIDLDKNYCVIVKVSNEDSTKVYGPFSITPANITLKVTGTESVTYQCGTAIETPQYTAELSAGENSDDYTFVWTYGNETSTGGTTFSPVLTGNTTVTCTATHNTGFSLTGSVAVTVVNLGTAPVIAICTDSLTVTDKGSTGFAEVKWDENGTFESVTVLNHTYNEAGEYIITAKSAEGCTASRTVAVTKGTFSPCEVSDTHPAQLDVVGGVEETDGTGKIISVSDKDENTYSVVQIGSQCWMAKNLRATQYSDGTAIALGSTTASPDVAYRYAPNGDPNNVAEYGYLYNWLAATRGQSSNSNNNKGVQGACPRGWHIPTNDEWTEMEKVVNGGDVIYPANMVTYGGTHGGKLATGCAWEATTEAQSPGNYTFAERNASGFSALPAGRFTGYPTGSNNGYYNITLGAEFWSCTFTSSYGDEAWHRALRFDNPGMSKNKIDLEFAFSVRCVRDTVSPTSQEETVEESDIVIDLKSSCVTQNNQVVPSQNVPNAFSNPTEWTSDNGREKGQQMTSGGQTYIVIDSVSDYENGHWYKVVQIGSQCWMKENLRATKYGYNTNDQLNLVTTNSEENASARNYYHPGNNEEKDTCGLLYNWKAATNDTSETMNSNVRGICPAGWHVPSDGEWFTLENTVNNTVNNMNITWTYYSSPSHYEYINTNKSILVGALSEGNWSSFNPSNSSGFSALPAGYKWDNNSGINFSYPNEQAHFWTSSVDTSDTTKSWTHQLRQSNQIWKQSSLKTTGRSVRCVRN